MGRCRGAAEKYWAAALVLALSACGDSAEDHGNADGDGDGEQAGDGQADGDDADGAGDGGDPADGDEDMTGDGEADEGDGEGADSPEVAACAGAEVELPAPSAGESVQWIVVGAAANQATPPAGGAYYTNGFLNLTTYTASFSGSISIAAWEQYPEKVPAGTYRCSGQPAAQVNVNGLGPANPSTPGTDCEVTFEQDVVDGGRLTGSFWAYYAPAEWPIASEGGCVHGRFDVTDAAE